MKHDLHQFGDNVFVNLAALNVARFEDDSGTSVAHLIFKDGQSETIRGQSALEMRRYLAAEMGGDRYASTASAPQTNATAETTAGAAERTEAFMPNLEEILKSTRKKAWYYRKGRDDRSVILACANVGQSCSVRLFDAKSGVALGIQYGRGRFQETFSEITNGATDLTVDSQPNLARDCKERLPERLFNYLRNQIERLT